MQQTVLPLARFEERTKAELDKMLNPQGKLMLKVRAYPGNHNLHIHEFNWQ